MTAKTRRNATAALLFASMLGIAAATPAGASAASRISTVAGDGSVATLNHPRGLAAMPDGSFLLVEAFGHRVRQVFPDGTMRTVAGTGAMGYSGDGGAATSARLNLPHAVALLPDGGFLIADTNNFRIRRVSPSGIITTVAGIGIRAFSGDGGPAIAARISAPRGLASLPDGSYLIADSDNNRVRRVSSGGTISTVAGTGTSGFGGDGGSATSAAMNSPFGVAPLAGGGFLVADADNRRVRRVSSGGIITTVAGTGGTGSSGDGGPATAAQIAPPYNVSPLGGGFLIADTGNHRVRKVSSGGTITTVAGTGAEGFSGDGGSATRAQLAAPTAALPVGNGFLIADSLNHRVRRVRSASCRDGRAPVSYYSRGSGSKARHGARLKLSGRARDRGCARVAKVTISIARVEGGGRCRQLGSKGRLGSRTSCSKRKFLKARRRSSRWSFVVRRGLPRGTYVAQVRSVDRKRNLERRKQTRGAKRNVIRFKVS